MALARQVYTIDFGVGGIDQRTDPKRIVPIKFSDLVDVRFTKIGRIERRRAMESFAMSVTVSRLLTHGNQLYAVSKPVSGLPFVYRVTRAGATYSQTTATSTRSIDNLPVSQIVAKSLGPTSPWAAESVTSNWSYAQSNSYIAVSYYINGGSSFVEIYDKETHSLVNSVTIAGAPAQIFGHPGGRDEFVFGYASGTTIVFNLITPSAAPVAVSGLPDEASVSSSRWDAAVVADGTESTSAMIGVIYAKGASGVKLRTAAWPGTGGSGSTKTTTTVAIVSAGSTTIVAMAGFSNASNTSANFRPLWIENSGGTLVSGVYNHSLTVQIAPAAVTTMSAPSQLGAVVFDDATSHVWVNGSVLGVLTCYSINASNTSTLIGNGGGIIKMTQALCKPMGAGDASGLSYIWGSYSFTTNQSTAFMLGASSAGVRVQGRAFHLRSWSNSPATVPNCNAVWDSSSKEIVTAIPRLNRSATIIGGDSGSGNIGLYKMSASPYSAGWLASQRQDEMLVSGGFGCVVNGIDAPIPSAPLLFPVIAASSLTSSGGALTAGSYQVSGFFEMVDDRGMLRRSEAAEPVTVALSGTQVAFSVTVNNYGLADGLSGQVRFVATRTLVNESQVYYRDSSYSTTSTTSIITVSFTASDATIAAYEPMYTVGGVFDDSAASCLLASATNGRRTLAVFGDDPTLVVESKPDRAGYGTAFMAEVGRRITSGGDRIYALASYLDRWFAFKKDGTFVATGDGADPTGQNDTLSEFEPLSAGIGCTDPRSVLVTSVGVVFLSARGFYILGSDLTPRPVGDDIAGFVDALRVAGGFSLLDACYDPRGAQADYTNQYDYSGSTSERCFFLVQSNGAKYVLVLSIVQTMQGVSFYWSRDVIGGHGQSAVAAIDGRLLVAVDPDVTGIVRESNEDSSDEYASSVDTPAPVVETAWIGAGSIQGLGRVYKVSTLGDVAGSVTVTVAVGYDFSANWPETHNISTAVMQNGQFEFAPQRTRFDAIRFRITQTSITTAAGYMPTQMQLVVGIKDTANKLPATAKARKT